MTAEQGPVGPSTISPGSLAGLVDVSNVHLNVSQDLIITTEDKVRIHLSSHLGRLERKRAWIAPLGVLMTIVITLLTANFKEQSFLLGPDVWHALFVVSAVLSGCWLLYALKDAWKSESVDDLIEKLKKESR